jgi:hypothetical protein
VLTVVIFFMVLAAMLAWFAGESTGELRGRTEERAKASKELRDALKAQRESLTPHLGIEVSPGPDSDKSPSETLAKAPSESKGPTPPVAASKQGAKENAEAKQTVLPEPAKISLLEYEAIGHDDALPPLARERRQQAFRNKTIDWHGYFEQATLGISDTHPIQVVLSDKQDSAWLQFKPEHEGFVNTLKNGEPIHVAGVISQYGVVEGDLIVRVPSSTVSMAEYFKQIANGGQAALKVVDANIDKHVDWMAYFYSMDYEGEDRSRIRIDLTPSPEGYSEYLLCRVSSNARSALPELSRGKKVHISGMLVGKNDLKLMAIALADGKGDWKAFSTATK